MSQYILLLLVVLLFPLYRLFKRESTNTQYLLSKEQNQILALAHPLAQARIEGGFADQPLPQFSEKLLKVVKSPPTRILPSACNVIVLTPLLNPVPVLNVVSLVPSAFKRMM